MSKETEVKWEKVKAFAKKINERITLTPGMVLAIDVGYGRLDFYDRLEIVEDYLEIGVKGKYSYHRLFSADPHFDDDSSLTATQAIEMLKSSLKLFKEVKI